MYGSSRIRLLTTQRNGSHDCRAIPSMRPHKYAICSCLQPLFTSDFIEHILFEPSRAHRVASTKMDDPFMQMHRQMQQMQQAMLSGFPMMPSFPDPYRAAPQRQAPQYQSREPQVEVVDDDEPANDGTGQGAIVEEPDDLPHPDRRHRERDHSPSAQPRYEQPRYEQPHHRQQQMQPYQDPFEAMFPSFGGLGGLGGLMGMTPPSGSSNSYSYSSFTSSGGPGGVTYQETKTHRMGPGGVSESQHTVRDGRTGEEKMRLSRGLGDRKRTLEQARRHGREVHRDVRLEGFQRPEDAEHFDTEWQRAAAAMPRGHRFSDRRPSQARPQLEYRPSQHPHAHAGQRGYWDAQPQHRQDVWYQDR
eukprot:jgi/Ulvmu1/11011/UM007_0191.1